MRPAQIEGRLKTVWLALISLVAACFIAKYAFRYYLPGSAAQFGLSWGRRVVLLAHISGGIVALVVGPWQFSSPLRRSYLHVHRLTGRIYLLAVALGSVSALALATTTSLGWAWGFGVGTLAVIWLTTSAIAFYAILHRQITDHQRWMRRSYIATFAFVTVRFLTDIPPMSHLQPYHDALVTSVWVSWALPMFAFEVIDQLWPRFFSPRGRDRPQISVPVFPEANG
jgi:uncharacterized membrane protein